MDKQTKSFFRFIDNEFKELLHFKSSKIEAELVNRINIITTLLKEKSLFRLHYDDLLIYERGIETMPAYYGDRWTSECFFPFIQKNNPDTMLILELITLVYSKSIYQMVTSDIEVVNQIEKEDKLFFDKRTIDFLMKTNNSSNEFNRVAPLIYYISILKKLFVSQPATRELTIFNEEDKFYITTEMYRNITDKLLEVSQEARFNEIIQRIIGHYTLYFNKITYFTEIQPLFLKIIYDCLLNFEDILTFNNQYVKGREQIKAELNQSKLSRVRYFKEESLGVATQKKYFTTVGLHDGYFEMEILVDSSAETKEQSKKLGNSDKFHIGYLYEDKLVIKGEILTIKKEETDKYQFRVCKEWKPIVSDEDYEDLTWDEAVKYLMEEENRTLPFTLESYYFGTFESQPFVSN